MWRHRQRLRDVRRAKAVQARPSRGKSAITGTNASAEPGPTSEITDQRRRNSGIWPTFRDGRGLSAAGDWGLGIVHSRYERYLADAPVGGQRLMVRLRVRRWFCDQPVCGVRTFAEQVEGVTVRHGRRTPLLRALLEDIAVALAGRAGARLATALRASASRSTLLRLLQTLPDPVAETPRVLGGGRLRVAARSELRHRADRLRDGRTAGVVARQGRSDPGELAGRTPWGGGGMPRPLRVVRGGSSYRRPRRDAGRGQVSPLAEPGQGR